MRLGIFGGTFNPVHSGHLRTAEEARYKLRLDKVVFVPAGNPPLKDVDAVAASHRYAMATLAAASNKDFLVSDFEAVKRGKSYTVDTLQMLLKRYPGDELFFILGSDAFLDIPKWHEPEKLTGMTDFIIVGRPGVSFDDIAGSPYIKNVNSHNASNDSRFTIHVSRSLTLVSGRSAFLVPVTQMDISSTGIRRLVEEKMSIKYLLPASVERYIKKHKLYR
ncbi:MAG TPA: nicotinate-nucleotide adenylyltransferase [Dissulfurispiraceae bacterium]|nr:nicotinate-nucleotide adenylyltransferase [Dissulfurispiraceae bacterium]